MDVTALLSALGAHPEVREADARIAAPVAELRWHPALRRRWREARAESAMRSARASAELDGARLDGDWRARLLHGSDEQDPALAVARGIWQAQVHVTSLMPDLAGRGRPVVPAAAQLVSGLHRDLLAAMVGAGADGGSSGRPATQADVGRPRTGDPLDAPAHLPVTPAADVAPRLDALLAVVDADRAPALVRTAVAHAEIALVRPFLAGNGPLARTVARHLSVRSGLDPTGIALPDEAAAREPVRYVDALAAYSSGETDGVVHWVVAQADWLREGAVLGADVARSVLAGSTLDSA